MRTRSVLVLTLTLACSGGAGDTPPDGSESPIADAPAPDAPAAGLCPNRTAATGEPQTLPAPAEVVVGDVTIRNALDVGGLAGKKVVSGNVVIDTETLVQVSLPDLEVIAGALTIRGTGTTALETVELPRLETVGGAVVETATIGKITTYRLPRLETVGRFILLSGTTIDVGCLRRTDGTMPTDRLLRFFGHAGAAFPLPNLESGDLEIGGMANVTAIELPRFTHGSLDLGASLQPDPKLVSISAPVYTGGDLIRITGSPLLTTIAMPALRTAPVVQLGQLGLTNLAWLGPTTLEVLELSNLDSLSTLDGLPASLQELSALGNDALTDVDILATKETMRRLYLMQSSKLTTVELTALKGVDQEIRVELNGALTRITAPLLVGVGTNLDEVSRIRDNAVLSNACATAIRDRVLAATPAATFQVSGNTGPATCP